MINQSKNGIDNLQIQMNKINLRKAYQNKYLHAAKKEYGYHVLWLAWWLNVYRSLSCKPDDLSLIPRTHIKVEGETDSTELSSDLHMPHGMLMCTVTHNNVFWCLCLPACIYVYHIHVWYPQRPEEGIRLSGSGVIDGWEPPCGHWEPKPDPLLRPSALVPFLQPWAF